MPPTPASSTVTAAPAASPTAEPGRPPALSAPPAPQAAPAGSEESDPEPAAAPDRPGPTGPTGDTGDAEGAAQRPSAARPARVVPPQRTWVGQLLGVTLSVQIRGPGVSGPAVAARIESVLTDLDRVEELFHAHRPDSQLNRLNRGELALAGCDPELRQVAALCEAASYRTHGYVDARLPDTSGERRHNPVLLIRAWALDRAARRLIDLDDHDICLNAGGDLIVGHGLGAADHPPWRVGIGDPADQSTLLAVLALDTGAMARVTGPRNTSVAVTGPELLWATVYAHAALARDGTTLEWLDEVGGYEGLLVDRDGALHPSTGLVPTAL